MSDHPLPPLLQSLADQRPTRRPDGISGTDIKRIMAGDWTDLYLEKTGQLEPEPLLELPPLIGKFLAPLHIAWYEWQTGRRVFDQETVKHAGLTNHSLIPYVTLDGQVVHPHTVDERIPWEAKITNGYMQRDKLIDREYPQLQWQMMCCGTEFLELSVLYLNTRWESMLIERDDNAINTMIAKAKEFWWYVENNTLPPNQVVEQVTPVRELVDMRGSEDWRKLESVWLATRQPAKEFKAADSKLKKIIPPDAKTGFGETVTFTRNKAGAVTLLPMTKEQRAKTLTDAYKTHCTTDQEAHHED